MMAADTWQLKVVRTAPDLNTYNIFNTKRGACQNLFAGRGCGSAANTVVGVYTFVSCPFNRTLYDMCSFQPACNLPPCMHMPSTSYLTTCTMILLHSMADSCCMLHDCHLLYSDTMLYHKRADLHGSVCPRLMSSPVLT